MRVWRAGMVAALALGPASACVLFDGPGDYPPRDAGSGQDATASLDAGADAHADGGSGGGDAGADGNAPVDGAALDGAKPDTGAGDAPSDGVMCKVVGVPCQSASECCSLNCDTANAKC